MDQSEGIEMEEKEEWTVYSLEKSRMIDMGQKIKEKKVEKKPNLLDDVAENIRLRYLKYGRLDSNNKIARKTGAIKRETDKDRDINYYDQDDEFIDDSEFCDQNQRMILPEAQYEDFCVLHDDLQGVINCGVYQERIKIMNNVGKNEEDHKQAEDPQALSSNLKKKKKLKTNNGKALSQQDSLFIENLLKQINSHATLHSATQVKKELKEQKSSSKKQGFIEIIDDD